jgi:integrase
MRARVLSNALELIFQDVRSMAMLTSDAIVDAAKEYFRSQLRNSIELAFSIVRDPCLDRGIEIAGARQFALKMQEELALQHFSPSVKSDAEEVLKSIDPNATVKLSEPFRLACNAVLRARIENAKLHAEQLIGNYAVTSSDPWFAGVSAFPPIPGDQSGAVTCPTFSQVAKMFVEFKKTDWAPKTAADFTRVIGLGTALIGGAKPIKEVDANDVKRVRDILGKLPPNYMKASATKGLSPEQAVQANTSGVSLSIKTQLKYFEMFKQLLNWASHEDYIEKVPGGKLKVGGAKTLAAGDLRDPYSTDQLSKIFRSPLYNGHKSETARHKPGSLHLRDGYFWLPLIALYSGMRLGEIVQLLKSEVKQANGVWYFDVKGGEGKSLKTASSKRRVPIHPLLLQHGFLAVVKTGSLSGRIFPEIKKGTDGYASHNFSKWWGRYAAHVGFKTDRTTFHSFRHNFLDALHAANSPEYINKALMGHIDKSVHGGYGSGAPLHGLKEAIEKVKYPIDFSALLPA